MDFLLSISQWVKSWVKSCVSVSTGLSELVNTQRSKIRAPWCTKSFFAVCHNRAIESLALMLVLFNSRDFSLALTHLTMTHLVQGKLAFY